MKLSRVAAAGALAAALLISAQAAPRNVIIFVADGLRSHSVTPETAPALAAVRSEGVDFANSHSLYPTVTTANGSAIATGHLLGDTGDFGNTVYAGGGAVVRPKKEIAIILGVDAERVRVIGIRGWGWLSRGVGCFDVRVIVIGLRYERPRVRSTVIKDQFCRSVFDFSVVIRLSSKSL